MLHHGGRVGIICVSKPSTMSINAQTTTMAI
jgi:hypothetical protein